MPKIPMGVDVGLGTATFKNVVTTPTKSAPVAKELGPKLEVNPINVKEAPVADLASIKPVAPSMVPGQEMQQGIDTVLRNVEQIRQEKAAEIQQATKIKEATDLHVSLGDQKVAYTQNSMDILNNTQLSPEDKTQALDKVEGDFRAIIPATKPWLQKIASEEVMGAIASVKNKSYDVILKNTQDGIKENIDKSFKQHVLYAASSGNLSMEPIDALRGAWAETGEPMSTFKVLRDNHEQTILQNDIMATLKATDVKSGADALASVNDLYSKLTAVNDNNVPTNWTNLHPQQRFSDISEVINKKNAIEAAMLAQGNKELGNLKSAFNVNRDFYAEALKNGDPVDPSFAAAVKKQAVTLMQMDPDKAAGYMGILQLQKLAREYGPAYQMEKAAGDPLRGTGAQPISYADMSSPEALQKKLNTNIIIGQKVKNDKSLTFVPVLRADDMEGVAKTVETNPASGIRLVTGIKDALGKDGPQSLMYMAGQMANSKDQAAPATAAIIYNVAKGDMNTAQVVANGMEVIRNKSITMPKDTDLRTHFDRLLGNAMAESSANRGVNFEVYKTAYAGMAARKNLNDGTIDRDTAEAAFSRVVGRTIKWNGSSVLLPDGMTETNFMDYMRSITPETVQAWGGIHGMNNEKAVEVRSMNKDQAADFRDINKDQAVDFFGVTKKNLAVDFLRFDSKLVSVGPGRYAVEYEGKLALTADGRRQLIIDVNTPIINPRNPEIAPLRTRLIQMNEDATMLGH